MMTKNSLHLLSLKDGGGIALPPSELGLALANLLTNRRWWSGVLGLDT